MRIKQIIVVSLLVVGIVLPLPASAHDGEDHSNDDTNASASQTTKDYTFITPVNGSLSEIVRKALQTYDQENDKLSLTQAQLVAAEAAIVQQLGARLLEVGEQIKIPSSVLQEQITKAQALDAGSLAEWQLYAVGTDFDTSHIKAAATTQPAAAGSDAESHEKPKQETDDAAGSESSDTNNDRNSAYWLLVPLAVALLALVISRSHRSPTESSERVAAEKKSTARTRNTTRTRKK